VGAGSLKVCMILTKRLLPGPWDMKEREQAICSLALIAYCR
jgi:hypothetical protein